MINTSFSLATVNRDLGFHEHKARTLTALLGGFIREQYVRSEKIIPAIVLLYYYAKVSPSMQMTPFTNITVDPRPLELQSLIIQIAMCRYLLLQSQQDLGVNLKVKQDPFNPVLVNNPTPVICHRRKSPAL